MDLYVQNEDLGNKRNGHRRKLSWEGLRQCFLKMFRGSCGFHRLSLGIPREIVA
jgi:hypothetical protein